MDNIGEVFARCPRFAVAKIENRKIKNLKQ